MSSIPSLDWSEDKWREQMLRRELLVHASSVAALAEGLEHGEDFPTDTPPKLCKLIRGTAQCIGRHLPKTPADQLRHVSHWLCEISAHLRYVERSPIEHTPWSMIQAAELFLKEQAGENCEFIIRPQWSYNYSIIGDFVEAYRTAIKSFTWISLREWEDSTALQGSRVYCISFPRTERPNCLLHASWGHEVGHIIAERWICASFDAIWQKEEPAIKSAIEKEITKSPPPVTPLFKDLVIQELVAGQTSEAMHVCRQGLAELICDAVGVHLLGPAALAAATEFSARFQPDENPLACSRYPPWRYRLRLMLEACEEDLEPRSVGTETGGCQYPGDLIEPFVDWLSELRALVKIKSDTSELERNPITREAYRVISEYWQQIRPEALSKLPQVSFSPYRLWQRAAVIRDLVMKLRLDIPPGETGYWPDTKPAPFRDILNAAWVFKAYRAREPGDPQTPDDYNRLLRLALKAIESSYVYEVFGKPLNAADIQ